VELHLQRREVDVEGVHHIDCDFAVEVGNAEAVEHRMEVDRGREELKHMVLVVAHAIEEEDVDQKMAVRVFLEWKDNVVEQLEDTPDSRVTWIQQGDNRY
jgi:hypothetical protein